MVRRRRKGTHVYAKPVKASVTSIRTGRDISTSMATVFSREAEVERALRELFLVRRDAAALTA